MSFVAETVWLKTLSISDFFKKQSKINIGDQELQVPIILYNFVITYSSNPIYIDFYSSVLCNICTTASFNKIQNET